MRDDPTLEIISRLEETPAVRPAFSNALRAQLHGDLGFADATPAARQPARGARHPDTGHARWRLIPSFRPLTLRALALALVAVLVIAGTALGVLVITRTWMSAGDRGPQYTDDYSLAEVYREPDSMYTDVHLAPTGDSLLAFRQPFPRPWGSSNVDPREWAIVRIPLDRAGSAQTVMPLEDLRQAVTWDKGVDVAQGFVQRSPTSGSSDLLSVASNGDVFASVALMAKDQPAASSALVVIHPDGGVQTIVTARQLADEGLLSPLEKSNGMAVAGTPSSPDRLWVRAEAAVESGPAGAAYWLYEIVDPNSDGDWSDRVISPVKLPASMPVVDHATYEWGYGSFVSEPSTSNADRSQSILLPMTNNKTGEYRVYRLTDQDGDGDVTGPGDTELLVSDAESRTNPIMPVALAARVVAGEDGAPVEEQVLGGLTRPSRVTRVTPSGLQDIVRGLPTSADSVHAAADGVIYVTSQADVTSSEPASESGWAWVVYRLSPAGAGASPGPAAVTMAPASMAAPATAAARPAVPTATPLPAWLNGEVTPGVAQLYLRLGDEMRPTMVLLGADGSGPELLLPDLHPLNLCRSTDASKVAFVSDEEVPNEYFVYVANADGTDVVKMDEAYNGFECPFNPDSIVLWKDQQRYARHDLGSGADTVILDGEAGFISSDGRTLMVPGMETVGQFGVTSTMAFVDVATGTSREIDGRYADGSGIGGISWAPDGRRLAFTVGREPPDPAASPDQPTVRDMYVVDVEGLKPRLVTTFTGLDPDFAWSADGRTVTALVPSVTYRPDGTYTIISVDLRTGATSTLADTGAKWAAWSPVDPDTLAYATMDGLYVVHDGTTRQLATVDTKGETGDDLVRRFGMGWSPDGRWLGRVEPGTISMIDVATGVETPIWTDPDGIERGYPWWWR